MIGAGSQCPKCGAPLVAQAHCVKCGRLTIPIDEKRSLAWLVPIGGERDGKVVSLLRTTLVGADPACDVVLDSAHVSRQHARIAVGKEGFQVEDLQSQNGTFVNDTRVQGTRPNLVDGERVRFGDMTFIFKCLR